ncbi:MAG: hypothetical protein E7069_12135 [Bacteroidales bacterium]|jgi:hypothetical protein|nr:hypothetical protein [Bacteroidales bacterium]
MSYIYQNIESIRDEIVDNVCREVENSKLTGDKMMLEYVADYALYKSAVEREIEYVFGADAPIVKYLKERE